MAVLFCNYNNYLGVGVPDHVMCFVCSMQGHVNNSSRWNSKQPAKRQPRRADIDGEAEDDEVSIVQGFRLDKSFWGSDS